MNSIIALEELIKSEEELITFIQKQLSSHENGENKLSKLSFISAETKLEDTKELIAKHKLMLEELMQYSTEEIEEQDRIKEEIKRKKYFEEQNQRIKNNRQRSDDLKLEAMMILDELSNQIQFQDEQIFEIAEKSLDLNLHIFENLNERLDSITDDFNMMLKKMQAEDIKELGLLNIRIPILTLHFSILYEVFEKNFNEQENKQINKEKKNFSGFPKYEDWWINQLWSNHKAYFALYKWKEIVSSLCKTTEQKRAWNKTFDNWIFIKKILSDKGELGFKYQNILDTLLNKYAQLEEELDIKNLKSMENLLNILIKKEDFNKKLSKYNLETEYLKYKKICKN